MGVTRFESVVANQTVGTADIDKLAASFDKLSGSIDASGQKADKVAAHPGFDALAGKIKAGIEDPLGAAAKAAESALQAMGPLGTAVAGGAAIFGAAAIAGFEAAKALGEYGTQIQNVALRTGLSSKEVGQFSFAARLAGQDVTVFESAMRKLSQGLDDNTSEGAKARKGLGDLGVVSRDATGAMRPMSDIFLQISHGLNGIGDPAKRNAEALRVFGRAGIELMPTMLGLEERIKRAKELGLGATQEDLDRWEKYHQNVTEAEVLWERFSRKIKEPLAAAITFLLKDSGGHEYTFDELQKRGVNLGGFAPRTQYSDEQAAKAAGFGAGAGYSHAITMSNVLGFTDQVEARRRTDAAIDALKGSETLAMQLKDAEAVLSGLAAPTKGSSSMDDVTAYGAAQRRVESLKARVKAVQDLETAEKSLVAFEQRMGAKELGPVAQTLAGADALKGLNPEQAERARTAARIAGSEQLLKIEDDVWEKQSKNVAKMAELETKAWQEVYKGAGDAAQRSVDIWISTAEKVRQIGVQGQVQRAGGASQQRMGFLSLAAAPGQEGLLANAEYAERLTLATRIYDLQKAEADTMQDAQARRLVYAHSYAELMDSLFAAENAHEMQVAQLQRQRVEQFRGEMGGLFDAMLGGRNGLQAFAMNELRNIGRAAFSNTVTALVKTGDPLTRNTVFGGTLLADPTKDIAGTKLAGAGDQLTQAAGALQNAARSLAMSRSGGGGGFVPSLGGGVGVPGFDPANPDAITAEGAAWGDNWWATQGGAGASWAKYAGIGGAALGGGIGIYSGVRSGGARGALTAAGSAAAASGAILSLVLPKLASTLGPAGMVAGAVLGMVIPSLLGDPKKLKDAAESDTLAAARYTAPAATNYTRDRYGRDFDYDASGGLRPIIQVNIPVQAIDSQDFMDRSPQIVTMVTAALEDKVSPRLMTAVRNTVRVG